MDSPSLHDRNPLSSEAEHLNEQFAHSNKTLEKFQSSDYELVHCHDPTHHKAVGVKREDYEPTTLRWPFLGTLLVLLLALMGSLIYGLHVLPSEATGDSLLDNLEDPPRRRDLILDTSRGMVARAPRATAVPGYESNQTEVSGTDRTEPTQSATIFIDTTKTTNIVFITPLYTRSMDAFGVINKSITDGGRPLSTTVTVTEADTTSESTIESTYSRGSDAFGQVGHTVTALGVTHVSAPAATLTYSPLLTTDSSSVISYPVSTPTITNTTDSVSRLTGIMATNATRTPIVTAPMNATAVSASVIVFPIPTESSVNAHVYYINPSQYFVGFCLPTILSILLAMPIRAVSMNAKLFHPWHQLTQSSGSLGRESLNLPTGGIQSHFNAIQSLKCGQMLIPLTAALMMCSVLLVPLSAETIVLQLRGNCVAGSAKGCTFELGVSEIPTKAAIALLGIMCFLLVLILFFLRRWKSGVNTNPWSICGMAGLSQNGDVQALFSQGVKSSISLKVGVDSSLKKMVADRRFRLGRFQNGYGQIEYGIMLLDTDAEAEPLHRHSHERQDDEHFGSRMKDGNRLPFMLGYIGRLVFLAILVGLLVLILYYNNTGDDTAFEKFMDGQSFGTKFLFTSIGTVVTLFWSSFVSGVAIISPYQLLCQRPQMAKHSILLSPPTNALSGILSGIRRRHFLLVVVGMTALLSEFLTIFLSNVPYRATQTFLASRICAWGSISILSIMTLVVIVSLFVKWPYMPADPSTITGAMYYVCDSWMLRDFEHFSVMDKAECNKKANSIGQSYKFGELVGQTGVARVGVDVVGEEEICPVV